MEQQREEMAGLQDTLRDLVQVGRESERASVRAETAKGKRLRDRETEGEGGGEEKNV